MKVTRALINFIIEENQREVTNTANIIEKATQAITISPAASDNISKQVLGNLLYKILSFLNYIIHC